jgi:transcriptional regulator of acetoin/glycerol metabolism
MGLNPHEIPVFKEILTSRELRRKLTEYEDVLIVVRFFVKKLLVSLAGTPMLIVISDDMGTILEMKGNATIKSMIEQLGIQSGVRFTEEACGTNVINLALSQLHPIEAIGNDHYHDFFTGSACYSAPFHYTDINNLLGTVSIMT